MSIDIESRTSYFILLNTAVFGFVTLISYIFGEVLLERMIIPFYMLLSSKYHNDIIASKERASTEIKYQSPYEEKLKNLRVVIKVLERDKEILEQTGDQKSATEMRKKERDDEISQLKNLLDKLENNQLPNNVSSVPDSRETRNKIENAEDVPELGDAIVSIEETLDYIKSIRGEQLDGNDRKSLEGSIDGFLDSIRKLRRALPQLDAELSRSIRLLLVELEQYYDPLNKIKKQLIEAKETEMSFNIIMSRDIPIVLSHSETKKNLEQIYKEISILEHLIERDRNLHLQKTTSIEARKYGWISPKDYLTSASTWATGACVFLVLVVVVIIKLFSIRYLSDLTEVPSSSYSTIGGVLGSYIALLSLILLFGLAAAKQYREYLETLWTLAPSEGPPASPTETDETKRAEIRAYRAQEEHWKELSTRKSAASKEGDAWDAKKDAGSREREAWNARKDAVSKEENAWDAMKSAKEAEKEYWRNK